MLHGRDPRGPLERLVERVHLDLVVAAEPFLGLCERAVCGESLRPLRTNRRRGLRRLERVAHDQGAGLVEALGVLPELREHRVPVLLGSLGRVARNVDEQHLLHGSSLVAFSVTTNGAPDFDIGRTNAADSLRAWSYAPSARPA